jgi:polyhydroxyalkanoate synthesis regulator phasin
MNDKVPMSDMLERVFLLGVGAASITREKVQELVDELVKKGQLSKEEGEALLDKTAERAKEQSVNFKEMASDAYQDTLRTMNIASREQIEELEHRIAVMESKVYGKPTRSEEPQTGFVSTPSEDEKPS